MKNKSILVLVVACPGPLQDGLLALMTTIPQISAVLVAEEAKAALRIVENHQPSLVILDYALRNGQILIQDIHTQWPRIQLILMVEDHDQEREVQELGGENVLLKGFSAQKLVDIVENFIEVRESASQSNTFPETNTNDDGP